GGGGYYGGGGGGTDFPGGYVGAGGGGSGFLIGSATAVTTSTNTGNGSVSISYVMRAATTTALTVPATGTAGKPVTLSASVTSQGATPTGSVTFLDGTTTLGTAALSNGVATLSVTLPAGSHSVSASYSGAGGFATSVSSAQVILVRAPVATPTPAATTPTATPTVSPTPTASHMPVAIPTAVDAGGPLAPRRGDLRLEIIGALLLGMAGAGAFVARRKFPKGTH
ncbi:MAG: hypothetical protein QOK10_1920, partial [Pseudonocardiales bacterium]|nr:hypothetical protein [Pseudonocardiales bacterium]